MSAPTITGFASNGVDYSGIVTQLVAIARQPIAALTTKKNTVDSAAKTLDAFSSQLATLQGATRALSEPDGFVSLSATSSDPALVATTSSGALAGSYSVDVKSLAQVEKRRSSLQASSGTALGAAGTLSLGLGSATPVDVSIAATDTLGDVATKINASGARVSASVLYDGSSYRLVLQGLDTGAANKISVTQTGFDLGLATPANVYQAATDASVVVDGMTVTRPTNAISGVIPGVTFALTKPTTSPATLTLASDTGSLKSKIEAMVAAYNAVVSTTHAATGYGTTAASNPVLAGDSAMRRSLDRLSILTTGAVPNARGAYTTLASVGLALAKDGTIAFDAAKLDSAMAKDASGVERLFVTSASTGATGVMKTLTTTIDDVMTGSTSLVKARRDALTTQSKAISDSIEDKGRRVDAYQANLKAQYAKLDAIMSRYQSLATAIDSVNANSKNNK